MTLEEYFSTQPKGSKVKLAKTLGISKTWLSLLISKRQQPSPELAREIEIQTKRKVKRRDLRPDLFGTIETLKAKE
jgi:DNA-binding transcriptional regulator YdaS (Cro superfamily)